MTDLRQFEEECRAEIPLLNAMQLSFIDYEGLSLTMEAPLAPNINNKGTAFGGSIASICLFGGWAVATLAFTENEIHNTEIVVFRNEMTFERPARGLLRVRAYLEPDDFEACLTRLQAGDSSRIRFDVHVELFHDDERCATMQGLYVVWLK
jgi:thioesterase domain-containing protein